MGVAGGVIGAIGSIAGALISAEAQADALHFQKEQIRKQQARLNALSSDALNAQATIADIARRANGLLAQEKVDPALAAIRAKGAENVLKEADKTTTEGDVLASTLYNEIKDSDPRMQALKSQLLSEAKNELDAGASLPPDFQAELVRTGLERGGTAGFRAGSGAQGNLVRGLIGREGIALKQQRQDQAIKLASTAQDIDNARVNILSGVFPKLKDLQTANMKQAQSVLATGEATVPVVGLGGSDITDIELAKIGAQGALSSKAADVSAAGALAQAANINQLIGAGTSLATTTLGGAAQLSKPGTASLSKTLFGY